MDGLRVGKHVNTLLIFICVTLQIASSQYPGRFAVARDLNRQVTSYPESISFRRFLPNQQLPSNTWRSRSVSLNRSGVRGIRPRQNRRISSRQFRHDVIPRVRTNRVRRPINERLRSRLFRMYNRQLVHPRQRLTAQVPRNRPSPDDATKISVVTGPLSKVIQHPTPRYMNRKQRMRYRVVAKAKSFPGILKDTSLDVTTV